MTIPLWLVIVGGILALIGLATIIWLGTMLFIDEMGW